MSSKLRIFTTAMWAVAILGMCAVLAQWSTAKLMGPRGEKKPQPIVIGQAESGGLPEIWAPGFELVDQSGSAFAAERLKGKVWVADFFFTTCEGPCPLMTQRMAELVKKLPQEGVEFVSFSVDPETDTPAVLKEYAAKHTDDARWHFLTGGDNVTYNLAREFKLVARPADGNNPIFHTTKFVLVGPTGRVAGYYDYNDPEHLARLVRDAEGLVKGDAGTR